MKLTRKTKILLALIVNIAIVVMEIIGIVRCARELTGFKGLFLYYTEDSNMFLTLTSIITIIYLVINLFKEKEMPRAFQILKFASVCTVIETFLIVVFILGFQFGPDEQGHSGHYQMLFMGSMLFHHFLCPVISCLSLLFLEGKENDKFTFKDSLYAFIPTIIYGVIIIFLNIIKVVVGPYLFLHVYEQTLFMSLVWVVVVLGCAFGITIGLAFLYNKINKAKE